MLAAFVPLSTLRNCIFNSCVALENDKASFWWLMAAPILIGAVGVVVGGLVNKYLLKYFGDVARYVKAEPLNVARRQEIREKGVELLETLMGFEDGKLTKSQYDRIVVVAHSLGTIVAYDILSHCFARLNTTSKYDEKTLLAREQPERDKLESTIGNAAGLATEASTGATSEKPAQITMEALGIDEFQEQQNLCLKELVGSGCPWIVSDFVTLGSPLAHAEFLLAADLGNLHKAQERRVLPTCPPAMEYDGKTRQHHFTYRHKNDSKASDPLAYRIPHHAALFAYTRWTNLYSPHSAIFWGDIISGPLASQFSTTLEGKQVSGIRDVMVLPQRDVDGRVLNGEQVPFFSHTKYWNFPFQLGRPAPHHIKMLRKALRLKEM
ncbi:hypothetical protein [Phyllobacterium sp.]|uniref:hypothetical protein n=1 Tax=Phyllobacterium sp. TaxID=1871046 RepID=UPI0030F3F31D